MTAKTKFKSPAFEAIHSAAAGLYSVDAIAQETMRSFDETCISRVSDFQPGEIKALRDQLNVSQPVFARYLNVSKNLISDWERGVKKPGGPALRLLTVVKKNGIQAIAC